MWSSLQIFSPDKKLPFLHQDIPKCRPYICDWVRCLAELYNFGCKNIKIRELWSFLDCGCDSFCDIQHGNIFCRRSSKRSVRDHDIVLDRIKLWRWAVHVSVSRRIEKGHLQFQVKIFVKSHPRDMISVHWEEQVYFLIVFIFGWFFCPQNNWKLAYIFEVIGLRDRW